MKLSNDMEKNGFGWPFWGGMSFIIWSSTFVGWLVLIGPLSSLSKAAGVTLLWISLALIMYGYLLFTRIPYVAIHKIMAFTTVAFMAVSMIGVMTLSEGWSLERALGIS